MLRVYSRSMALEVRSSATMAPADASTGASCGAVGRAPFDLNHQRIAHTVRLGRRYGVAGRTVPPYFALSSSCVMPRSLSTLMLAAVRTACATPRMSSERAAVVNARLCCWHGRHDKSRLHLFAALAAPRLLLTVTLAANT